MAIGYRKVWCGVLSSNSLLSKIQQQNNDTSGNVTGLFIVCGSWNRGMIDIDPQIICDLLANVRAGSENFTMCGILQVDINDDDNADGIGGGDGGNFDSASTCIGDDGCTSEVFPCPPAKLPALLFVGKRRSMPKPEIRYIKSFFSEDIYLYCMDERREYEGPREKPTLPYLISIRNSHMETIGKEISDQIRYLGLTKNDDSDDDNSNNINSISTPVSSKEAIRIFIAGDRMSVGKTSVCLGLIGALIQSGEYPPNTLAYIKPATQNESPQLVQQYCEKMGIDCIPIGPVVYYRGFTRAFLAGKTESSAELLSKVETAVDKLARNKRVVIIDGVGFPAVGSICGTDNASVARASGYPSSSNGRIPPGVLLVGGSGVGSAVDAFNLNATYFEKAGVPVLGSIFNKLSLDGFYSLENCREQITSYFNQNEHQLQLQRRPFGFVPMFDGLGSGSLDAANEYIQIFSKHVNMNAILESAGKVQSQSFPIPMMIATTTGSTTEEGKKISSRQQQQQQPPSKRQKLTTTTSLRSRQAIEQAAIQAGAAPSA